MPDIKQLMQLILENLPFGVFVVNPEGQIEYANSAMCDVSGLRLEEMIGANIIKVESYRQSGIADRITALLKGQSFRLEQFEHTSLVGVTSIRNAWGIPLTDRSVTRALVFVEDITGIIEARNRERRLQAQLIQAQKMESFGRLAGGVAHDFNNLLSVILSNCEVALGELPPEHEVASMVSEIFEAGERAATLTRQLLAFSRRQVLKLEVMELNAVVGSVLSMLQRVLGEDISIHCGFRGGGLNVEADRGQLEQVVMNLAMNARDAMPDGGVLTIKTDSILVGAEGEERGSSLHPGRYAVLSITDTGEGMTEEVRKQVFEPFFTTKAKDRGTGLGLATVCGIITQHRGHVEVSSHVGQGATFEVYLPETAAKPAAPDESKDSRARRGSEVVVVVEDEAAIRRTIAAGLTALGYIVLAAATGEEALARVEAHGRGVDLLLTDVVMPGMNGRDLADRITATHPETAVIFMSGYTDGIIAHHGVLEPDVFFIQKPVTPASVAAQIRDVLDAHKTNRGQ